MAKNDSVALETEPGEGIWTLYNVPHEKLYWGMIGFIIPISLLILTTGTVSNIVNIVVFFRMKTTDNITISLLALSISDLMFSLLFFPSMFVQLGQIFYYYLKVTISWPFDYRILSVLLYWYASTFFEASTLITVYIAVVRCACVAIPLKVKLTFTRKKTTVAIVAFFAAAILVRIPTFLKHRIAFEVEATTNITRLVYIEIDDGGVADTVNDVVNRNILPWSAFIVVVCSVCILVTKLQHSARFRHSLSTSSGTATSLSTSNSESKSKQCAPSTACNDTPLNETTNASAREGESKKTTIEEPIPMPVSSGRDTMSSKETQVIKSVVLVSVIFIMCQLPFVFHALARRFVPGYDLANSLTGSVPQYIYLYAMMTSINQFTGFLNASINILVYYNVNSRYRQCLQSLWCKAQS